MQSLSKTKISAPIIALCTGAVLLSCEPQPIPVTLPDPPAKLVVSSQMIPDRTLLVGLTRTFNTLEGATQQDSLTDEFLEKILVDSALVTVSYGDQSDTLEMLGPGIYAGTDIPQSAYATYRLYAHDPQTGETVTATSVMQPEVRFERVQPDIVYSDGETTVEISYAFRDDPSERNWYLVNFYKKVSLSRDQLDLNNYFERGRNAQIEFDLISDENLKDPEYTAIRKLHEIDVSDTIAVSIANVSQEYYQFLTLYQRAGNLITRISGEPVEYPTNVTNGYGYFTTHLPDIRFFDLKEYE
jgi:hypothetical protein